MTTRTARESRRGSASGRTILTGAGVLVGALLVTIGPGAVPSYAAGGIARTATPDVAAALPPAVVAPHVSPTDVPGGAALGFSPASAAGPTGEAPLVIERLSPTASGSGAIDAWWAVVSTASSDGLSTEAEPGSLSPHAATVATFMRQHFGVSSIGGYRPASSPHDDPVHGHAAGKALDLMVAVTPEGMAKGDDIARFLREYATELRVEYVIWNQQIWSSSRPDDGWRPMADRGSDTQNHKDHVHVSFQ